MMNIPDDLLGRAQILADTEGISLEAFIVRCIDDAVVHMERANAELDAADEAAINDRSGTSIHLRITAASETPKRTEPARTMVYQPKAQVRREIEQACRTPHPSESRQAVMQGIEETAARKRRQAEEAEAERQANQQKLEECRRQAVEGMRKRLGMDKDAPRG